MVKIQRFESTSWIRRRAASPTRNPNITRRKSWGRSVHAVGRDCCPAVVPPALTVDGPGSDQTGMGFERRFGDGVARAKATRQAVADALTIRSIAAARPKEVVTLC